jgi:hypothetical protein
MRELNSGFLITFPLEYGPLGNRRALFLGTRKVATAAAAYG